MMIMISSDQNTCKELMVQQPLNSREGAPGIAVFAKLPRSSKSAAYYVSTHEKAKCRGLSGYRSDALKSAASASAIEQNQASPSSGLMSVRS